MPSYAQYMDPLVSWFRSLDAAQWQAVFTGATFVTAVVASVVALAQFNAFRRTQLEQARPYVVVDFSFRGSMLGISAQNTGRTSALNVLITFTPKLESSNEKLAEAIRTVLARPIGMMAPGRRMEWFLDGWISAMGNSDVQQDYSVDVEYREAKRPRSLGRRKGGKVKLGRHYYNPRTTLDLKQYEQTTVPELGIPELVAAVRALARPHSNWPRGQSS